jgi:hypothetical protein
VTSLTDVVLGAFLLLWLAEFLYLGSLYGDD